MEPHQSLNRVLIYWQVSNFDAGKMIEAALDTPGKDAITFEEFKAIMYWQPPFEPGNTALRQP